VTLRIAAEPAFANRRGNPYQWLLATELVALGADVEELRRASILDRRPADVVHVHWPEACVNAPSTADAVVRAVRTLTKLGTARVRRIPVVWTVHNLATHEQRHPRLERMFWRLFVPLVSAQISHSRRAQELAFTRFPRLRRVPGRVTPHGHWRGVYPTGVTRDEARAELGIASDARVLAFVGRIKPYKGVQDLLAVLRSWDEPCTVVVAGNVDDPALAAQLAVAAGHDDRIRLHLDGVADDELQTWFAAADVVVCPYRAILNSASALLALSFDRPVVVPALGALPDLADEEGPWVTTYPPGALSGDVLAEALQSAATTRGRPCLAGRDWPAIAATTLELYREVARGR
jgi:beta-1,4-mannosyltransferase